MYENLCLALMPIREVPLRFFSIFHLITLPREFVNNISRNSTADTKLLPNPAGLDCNMPYRFANTNVSQII